MYVNQSSSTGMGLACLAAGPIFLTSGTLADMYLKIPEPIPLGLGEVVAFIFLLVPAFLFGAVISVIPNALGTAVMQFAGARFPPLRAGFAWLLAGGAIGTALTIAFEAEREVAVALIATSAVCARICRGSVAWTEEI